MTDNQPTPHSRKKRHTGFQARFLLVLAGILIIFSGVTAATIYYHEIENLEQNAHEKTDLIMKAIEANRDYIQDVLRPTMYKELGGNRFILEAMSSSYISRMIMERFSSKAQGFTYRRVAVNAKNPEYEANDLESEMVKRFRDDPALTEWQGIIDLESRQYFMRFQPVIFKASCLNCHGDPDDAPAEVTNLYGKTRGYSHKVDEISGVIGVGMPVDVNLEKIKTFTMTLFFGVVPSILIVYVIISAVFNRFIASNLRNILSFFRTNIKDDKGKDLFEHSQEMDEIDELTATARAIADHLHHNQSILEKYADEVSTSKDLLQSVFDGISDPVLLLDHEGRIKVVNKAFRLRYNLSMHQVIGQKPSEFLSKELCPLAACDDIFISNLDHPISREIQVAAGEIFLIYFYPVEKNEARTGSMVCYVKDITEQKRMESKIQHTEKIASIGQLAAGIAHEINNPLGVILCHIDLIKGDANLSPETLADFEIIEKHAGNCRTIIADLLKFAHQQISVKEPVSLNTLLEEGVAMVSSQLRKQQIETHLDLDWLPPVTVDADKIKQVILNMLLNSAQAIEQNGTIWLRSRYDAESRLAVMSIEDNGPGIPAEIREKIFDPFFTTKPPGKGTGLGLSVSYGIIRDHNGDITVESLPGRPTRFVISIPTGGGAA
ncbi:MAG: sensor histidine kinase [uncultured bacterium]|nr:MAG: sensor histidine kinase [uncultured bacterium]